MLDGEREIGQRLLSDLRARLGAPGLELAGPPEPIPTGAESAIYALSFAQAPEGLAGPLILRCQRRWRDARGIRFETALQRALVAQGYPAPDVVLACDDPEPLGGAYLLMRRIPGRVLLGEITQLDRAFASAGRTLRSLPRLLYEAAVRTPRELGDWMLRLHALDTGLLIDAIEAEGFSLGDFTIDRRLARLEERAAAARLDGLDAALGWLRERYRVAGQRVLCHADFHFLNVLVAGPRVTGIVDWSFEHVCFEDPAFDVGNTRALLDLRLPGVPRAVRPAVRRAQRRLLDGFTSRYRRGRRPDPERVLWAEVYRYTREMVGAGAAIRRGATPRRGELVGPEGPWLIPEVMAGCLSGIERRTGVAVSLPEPS